MNSATVALWFGRLAFLAVCIIDGAAILTAPSMGGSTYFAAALGAVFGVGVWSVAVFGPPEVS
jgi:hypothetical protein